MSKDYIFIYSGSEIKRKSSIHVKRPHVGTGQNRTAKLCFRKYGGKVGGGIFCPLLQVLRGGNNFYSIFLMTFSHPFLKWTPAEITANLRVKSPALTVSFTRVRSMVVLKVSAYMQGGLLP